MSGPSRHWGSRRGPGLSPPGVLELSGEEPQILPSSGVQTWSPGEHRVPRCLPGSQSCPGSAQVWKHRSEPLEQSEIGQNFNSGHEHVGAQRGLELVCKGGDLGYNRTGEGNLWKQEGRRPGGGTGREERRLELGEGSRGLSVTKGSSLQQPVASYGREKGFPPET